MTDEITVSFRGNAPKEFCRNLEAKMKASKLEGSFEFIVASLEEIVCKQEVSVEIANEYARKYIIRFFDLCADSVTSSYHDRTSVDIVYSSTVRPLGTVSGDAMSAPLRKRMDIIKKCVDEALKPAP